MKLDVHEFKRTASDNLGLIGDVPTVVGGLMATPFIHSLCYLLIFGNA